MPQYATPPWLAQPAAPNPAEAFIQNLHVGAQIGMEKQRLQQQAVQAQMAAQARADELERRHALEAQQIEIDRAHQQQAAELKQRELAQQEQVVQMRAQEAAQRFTARQRYQQRYQELSATGIDPDRAAATAALENAPQLGISASEIGAFTKALHPKSILPPKFMTSPGGAEIAIDQQTGGLRVLPRTATSDSRKMELAANTDEMHAAFADIASAKKELAKLPADLINNWNDAKQEDRTTWNNLQGQIGSARATIKRLKQGTPAAATPGTVPPGPATFSPSHDEDQTEAAPSTPSAMPKKERRVKVKSPEGKVGTIPESQLDDAKQQGYTEV